MWQFHLKDVFRVCHCATFCCHFPCDCMCKCHKTELSKGWRSFHLLKGHFPCSHLQCTSCIVVDHARSLLDHASSLEGFFSPQDMWYLAKLSLFYFSNHYMMLYDVVACVCVTGNVKKEQWSVGSSRNQFEFPFVLPAVLCQIPSYSLANQGWGLGVIGAPWSLPVPRELQRTLATRLGKSSLSS